MKGSTDSSTISWLSFATMFVIGTDTFVVAPLLPTLSHIFNVSPSISGWMVSAYALGYACFALISGPISDYMDRRNVLLVGLVAFTIATGMCALSQGFWSMIIFRFLAGISAAFVSPQIWASIPLLVRRENIVKTMGSATAGLAIAQIVGIPISSYLAIVSWKLSFLGISLASLVLLFILFFLFPSLPSGNDDHEFSIVGVYKRILQNHTLKMYMLGYLVFQTGNFEAISFFGSWLYKEFSMDLPSIGQSMMVIGLGNAIGSIYCTRLVKYIGLYKSLFYSFVILIGLYIMVPFAWNGVSAVLILSLIMLIAGFAFALFMSSLQSQAEGARGTVSSLANASMYIGATIGGGIGGVLLTNFPGFFGIAGFTVFCYSVSLIIYWFSGAFSQKNSNII